MQKVVTKLLFLTATLAALSCSPNRPAEDQSEFTEIDSLTDTYLTLQDSILNTWNAIVGDENEKLKSLHGLLHTLMATEDQNKEQLIALEQRLDKLEEMRFSQEDINDAHVVEEYDFASNSLVNEIISEAEARPDYPTNTPLQQMVDRVKIADQHISIYRTDYDSAASRFNLFLDTYRDKLPLLDEGLSKEKLPLF